MYLESELGLTVEERLAFEAIATASDTRLELLAESASSLWLMQFINAFAALTDVRELMQLVDGWAVTTQNEIQGRALDLRNVRLISRFCLCKVL